MEHVGPDAKELDEPPTLEKPKRTRRTKEQIEADNRKAAEESKGEANDEPLDFTTITPPEPIIPVTPSPAPVPNIDSLFGN